MYKMPVHTLAKDEPQKSQIEPTKHKGKKHKDALFPHCAPFVPFAHFATLWSIFLPLIVSVSLVSSAKLWQKATTHI
jgi:hypothetical protein